MRAVWGAGLALALFGASPALAQQVVVTSPGPATSAGGNASSTITVTDTFQKVWGASSQQPGSPGTSETQGQRHGCFIQNNGTHDMYVTEGLGTAASTTSNSQIVAANGTFSCERDGVVLTGEIDITGTANDPFFAIQY